MALAETSSKTTQATKTSDWSYLPKEQLVDWLTKKEPTETATETTAKTETAKTETKTAETESEKKDMVIIDVREQDYGEYCIKGAKHHPFGELEGSIADILSLYRDVPNVVFHCAHSQVRGPTAATRYAEMRKEQSQNQNYPPQNIHVLTDGFYGFSSAYSPTNSQYQHLFSSTNNKEDAANKNENESKKEKEKEEDAGNENRKEEVSNEDVQYIDGNKLVEWLDDKSMVEKIQIIDVRDDDFVDSKINTAVNHPCHHFDKSSFVSDLIDTYKDKQYLVFHCAYSQQRGPNAAKIYHSLRFPSSSDHKYASYPEQTICVLEHGFRGFEKIHKDHCVPI